MYCLGNKFTTWYLQDKHLLLHRDVTCCTSYLYISRLQCHASFFSLVFCHVAFLVSTSYSGLSWVYSPRRLVSTEVGTVVYLFHLLPLLLFCLLVLQFLVNLSLFQNHLPVFLILWLMSPSYSCVTWIRFHRPPLLYRDCTFHILSHKSSPTLGRLCCFCPVSNFFEASQQIYFLWGEVVSLKPNPQPEGPRYTFLSKSSPLTCLALEALPAATLQLPSLSGSCDHTSPTTTPK
jgi:hypothetical protein